MQYIYILQSNKDGYLYVGCTTDLKKRTKLNNSGKVESTRGRRPLELIYYEAYRNKEDVYEREKFMKSGWGKQYIKKVLRNDLRSQKLREDECAK